MLYAGVKVSSEFAKALLNRGWSKGICEANKLYSSAILLCAIQKHGVLMKEEVDIGGEGGYSSKDPLPLFQVALAY